MKTLANIFVILSIGIIVGGLIWLAYTERDNKKCDEASAVMHGVSLCMNTPGCFYDADNLIDVKRAFDYNRARCSKNPA